MYKRWVKTNEKEVVLVMSYELIIEYYQMVQDILANNVFQDYGIIGLFFNSLLSATAIPLPTEILTSALLIGGEKSIPGSYFQIKYSLPQSIYRDPPVIHPPHIHLCAFNRGTAKNIFTIFISIIYKTKLISYQIDTSL